MVLKWWYVCASALTVIWIKSAYVRALRLLSKLHKSGRLGGRFLSLKALCVCSEALSSKGGRVGFQTRSQALRRAPTREGVRNSQGSEN